MAEIQEEILIDIKLDNADNDTKITSLTHSIEELKKANVDLVNSNKELAKTGQQNSKEYIENAKQIEVNKQKINENSASRKGLIQTIQAEDNSIKGLQVRNAELIKQRNLINTSTDEGKARITKINAEIDRNNEAIRANSSALEKQKINIGNYASALDGIVPGLGGFVSGIQNATKAAVTFIATPIGLVIAAIGLALGSLMAYFRGSEEGQDRLNKIMKIGSAIMERIVDVAEDIGEAIYNAVTNPKQAIIDFANLIKQNIINRFEGLLELIPNLGKAIGLLFEGKFVEAGRLAFDSVAKLATGIENLSGKVIDISKSIAEAADLGIKQGKLLADLQKQIRDAENKYALDSAKTAVKVAELREKAISQEGEARKKTIGEAIALENKLAKQQEDLAALRLLEAKVELETEGATIEAKKKVVDAEVALINVQKERLDSIRRFQKEFERLDDEETKRKEKAAEEDKKRHDAVIQEVYKLDKEYADKKHKLQDAEVDRLEINSEYDYDRYRESLDAHYVLLEENLAAETALRIENSLGENEIIERITRNANEERIKLNNDKNKKIALADGKLATIQKTIEQERLDFYQSSLSQAAGLFKKHTIAFKALAITETIINTARGITRALADYGFPYNLIVAALVGAAGTAQTAQIAGVKLRRGGILKSGGIADTGGVLSGPSHENGGIPFSVGGRAGFEAEGGEAIINKRSSSMYRSQLSAINQAGGGVAFALGGVAGNDTRVATQQAQSAFDGNQLATLINQVRTVLVLEEFEAKQVQKYDTMQQATVI